jgi:cytochrome c biogenesis protein CcdA
MVRLLGLVISIGLADSVNPSTIAPALYLAVGDRPRTRVIEFTIAVFVVYLAGGALIALGPGELLRTSLPHVHRTIRYIAEVVAGVLLVTAATVLWIRRDRLAARGMPRANPERKSSSLLLGATITAVELPTAFPYFAAIAAIAGSGLDPIRQLVLLVVFNVCFVLPLLAIVATLTFAGDRSERVLARCREFLERRWPQVLALLLLVIGVVAIVLGGTGLAAGHHGRVGRFFRHVRHFLHLRP